MKTGGDLYEPAMPDKTFDALWDIRQGRTFFCGPLYRCADHQHGAPVFLSGLYGKFRLRTNGGDWLSCRSAVIPAGLLHELDGGGEPIAVLYIEPSLAGAGAFQPLIGRGRLIDGGLVGNAGEFATMRELYENRYRGDWSAQALQDLLDYGMRRSPQTVIDPRLLTIVERLHADDIEPLPLTLLAAQVGLSASHLQHLFARQIGVPFRRYRAWIRMRRALTCIVSGENFTTAAYAAGFSDSAHFSHDFRKTFGAPPTMGLRRLARLQT